MNYETCPYCADPAFLASFTEGPTEKVKVLLPPYMRQDKFWKKATRRRPDYHAAAELRGDRLRVVFDGKNFDDRWRDFTAEVFGIESVGALILPRVVDRVFLSPPPPFFYAVSVPQGDNQPLKYQQFFICRITKKDSDVSIIVHWWADHGRVMQIEGSLSPDAANTNIETIKTGCDFFKRETRGNPRITEKDVREAIRKMGARAQQKDVARELKVTAQGLVNWGERRGLNAWRDVLREFSG